MNPEGQIRGPFWLLLAAWGLCSCPQAGAQWTTQTVNLQQGWNAVHLQVQPLPAECDSVFANLPVESVWFWNQRFSTVEYITDPGALLPGQPDWLVYLPATSSNRPVANLFTLQGGRTYLIKTTAAINWQVRGKPAVRNTDWLANSFNLVGFRVSSNSPPTFQSFFAPSPAQAGQPVFRLNSAGGWTQVISPSTTMVNPGEAYWVRSSGASTYSGFHTVTFEQGRSLDFGRLLVEQTLRMRNTSSNATTFTVKPLASAVPPNTSFPAVAGEVPLSYWRQNLASNQIGWAPLPASLTSPSIPPGGEWLLRLAVRRPDMASFSLPAGYSSAQYQSLLEISDALGGRELIPVTADKPQAQGTASSALSAQGLIEAIEPAPIHARAGLWIGSVVLNSVNQASASGTPVPVAAPFQFRVILHVDATGEARLLQHVILAWTNGVASTNNQGFSQTTVPGHFALITDDQVLAQFTGSGLRDGTVTGRRYSTAAFGFHDPILMGRAGDFGTSNTIISCSVPLGFNDSLNPFKHRYHPDHNNLDDRYELPKQECPDITRQISMEFTANDPENTTLAGWGDNQLGGIYSEVVTGLHKFPIHTQGTFRLHRASTVSALNNAPF